LLEAPEGETEGVELQGEDFKDRQKQQGSDWLIQTNEF
jgi:hypothetical protein